MQENRFTDRRALSLMFLRFSLGALMIVWGLDKFVNPAHGVLVATKFYFGLPMHSFMPLWGVLQLALGSLVILGLARRIAYPTLAVATGLTMVGVWRSILDPWGWMLKGSNALFFPSLIIFAGALLLIAFRDDDVLVLGTPAARAHAHGS
ncbi:MAG: DoxX family membrane protein [Gemmatimonadaceae bacterium]|nr:DoxX family membrane protein [Gemmatimonadaceae bacterium]